MWGFLAKANLSCQIYSWRGVRQDNLYIDRKTKMKASL